MTAYEMLISDWSSDVCSSDLPLLNFVQAALDELDPPNLWRDRLVVVVIAEVGKHRRAVRQRQAVALAADDPPDHRQAPAAGAGRADLGIVAQLVADQRRREVVQVDRKSTRLNSSH